MGSLLAHALRMAAPVLLALFLLEVFLGVLSRFAQQMNAFAVALALKSLVAFMGLVLILAQLIHTQLPELSGIDPLSFFLSASL
jgi:type III secretion protein T